MKINTDFSGGNLVVLHREGNTFFVERDLRDTSGDWFYWCFCVEDAECETLTFDFGGHNRIGYYGPAVSHDLKHWQWLNNGTSQTKFTYTFAKGENKVYFAHDMVYSPDMFYDFCTASKLEVKTFCLSNKGRNVPYVTFGSGDMVILLTSRHHCCESSGSYALQGVLEHLKNNLPSEFRVICVPFIDLDGVIDGDQGKNRVPHDHNRDYAKEPAIYKTTAKIRSLAETCNVVYAFDFHSPDHCGGCHDTVYIPRKQHVGRVLGFSKLLEQCITSGSMKYYCCNDINPGWEWNSPTSSCFANYWWEHGAELTFTLETTYFGTSNNIFSQDKAIELGHCFATALLQYIKREEMDVSKAKLTFTGDSLCTPAILDKIKGNFDTLFEKNSNDLKDSDFTVCNLETPVAGEGLCYTHDRYCFNTPLSYASSLKKAGADLVCLANNHCMDRGVSGILNTLDNLDSICLPHIGIYRNEDERRKIFIQEISGIKVAFLNYTYGTNCQYHHTFMPKDTAVRVNMFQPEETLCGAINLLASPEQINEDTERYYNNDNADFKENILPHLNQLKADIQDAKNQADFVLLVMHSGGQYNPLPDAYTKHLTHILYEYGVDFIVGHHPHIIQPCDYSEKYPTVYSIGNYMYCPSECTDKPVDPSYNIMLNLYLEKKDNRTAISKIGFKLLKVIEPEGGAPYVIDTYKLYQQCPSEKFKTDILHFANLFANKTAYTEPQFEYYL